MCLNEKSIYDPNILCVGVDTTFKTVIAPLDQRSWTRHYLPRDEKVVKGPRETKKKEHQNFLVEVIGPSFPLPSGRFLDRVFSYNLWPPFREPLILK